MGKKATIETNVNDCRDCPFKYDNVGHGECKTGQVEKRRENSMYNGTKDETYLSDVRIFHEPYSAEALTLLEKNVENLTDGSR